METIQLPFPVPYHAQVASPELAAQIFDGGLAAENDPRWRESGASTPAEYAYWTERACGAACVQMCVEALGGERRSLVAWAEAGAAIGGYRTAVDAAGQVQEYGWIHRSLAALCEAEGLKAAARPARPDEIAAELRKRRLVIASVSYELGDDRPITRRGGHLVLVIAAEVVDQSPIAFIVHNPSGRRPEMQSGARIPIERFSSAYAGRVIYVWKNWVLQEEGKVPEI